MTIKELIERGQTICVKVETAEQYNKLIPHLRGSKRAQEISILEEPLYFFAVHSVYKTSNRLGYSSSRFTCNRFFRTGVPGIKLSSSK